MTNPLYTQENNVTQRVAILGLGTMGIGMAKNVLKAGFPLAVYNRTRAKAEPLAVDGARIAETPADGHSAQDIPAAAEIGGISRTSREAMLGFRPMKGAPDEIDKRRPGG